MENKIQVVESADIQKAKPQNNQIEISQDAPPMVQIAQMMQAGLDIDVDKMEKLREIGEKYEANESRKAFARDFTLVQSEVASIIKTKRNQQTNSNYASLDDVIDVTKPKYTAKGFSVIFYEGKADAQDEIRVYADVLHREGHKETYHADIPKGGKGIKGNVNMTDIHAKATSFSYGRRYLMCMIWNIPTADNDGNGNPNKNQVDIPFPTEIELECLDAIIKELPKEPQIDRGKLAKWFLANNGKYPSTKERTVAAAEYVMQKSPDNIYVKEQ